jgi:Cytidylyltransferase-like
VSPQLPAEGAALYVPATGDPDPAHRWDPLRPTAILPGAFNPIHTGHRALAGAASQLLGLPVAFELSIANVDKPPLAIAEVRHRVAQFAGHAPVWLTHAPRFHQKAELFAGAVFVVGVDTAMRIVDPRYHGDDAGLHDALVQLHTLGCRFLVACRIDAVGRCIELADVPVPPDFRPLFTAIPAELFRLDISSTQIRSTRAAQSDGE